MTVIEHNKILALGFGAFAVILAFTILLLMLVSLGVFVALGISFANETGDSNQAGIVTRTSPSSTRPAERLARLSCVGSPPRAFRKRCHPGLSIPVS